MPPLWPVLAGKSSSSPHDPDQTVEDGWTDGCSILSNYKHSVQPQIFHLLHEKLLSSILFKLRRKPTHVPNVHLSNTLKRPVCEKLSSPETTTNRSSKWTYSKEAGDDRRYFSQMSSVLLQAWRAVNHKKQRSGRENCGKERDLIMPGDPCQPTVLSLPLLRGLEQLGDYNHSDNAAGQGDKRGLCTGLREWLEAVVVSVCLAYCQNKTTEKPTRPKTEHLTVSTFKSTRTERYYIIIIIIE